MATAAFASTVAAATGRIDCNVKRSEDSDAAYDLSSSDHNYVYDPGYIGNLAHVYDDPGSDDFNVKGKSARDDRKRTNNSLNLDIGRNHGLLPFRAPQLSDDAC